MNTALHELYTTKYWNILQESVPAFIKAIRENVASHRTFSHAGLPGMFLSRSHRFEPTDAQYVTDDPQRDIENPWCAYISDDDEFINLVRVDGGITRSNACSFGSRAQRDQVLYAAKRPNCIGHIFLINTPGGSAYSISDYTEAIEAARAAGQPVLACVDGLCASAGYALACQCDAIYYTAPSNIIGCIGTMAIYMTQKDGDQNTVTQEVYHEDYDPESYDKNRESRQAAEGDNSLILAELAAHGQAFRELVKKCRPQVKDEQLHGKTYPASEVEGTLVDAQLSLQGCIDLLANKQFVAPTTVPDASPSEDELPEEDKCNPKKKCSTVVPDASPSAKVPNDQTTNPPNDQTTNPPNDQTTNPPNDQTMIETNLQSALIEAQSALAEAQATLAEREQALQEAQAALDTANAQQEQQESEEVTNLNAQIADLQSQVTVLNDSVAERDNTLAERDASLSDATSRIASLEASLTERDTTIASHVATIAERDTALATANERIASLEASLAEAENTISELAHQPSSTATPSPATAGEGEGDEGKKAPESACASQPGMTLAERRAAQKARQAELNAKLGIR